jgi:hypothetical protein
MTIETKYNIGDEVWWAEGSDNTSYSGIISVIRINVFDNDVVIQYGIKKELNGFPYNKWLYDCIFPTKEELLKSS